MAVSFCLLPPASEATLLGSAVVGGGGSASVDATDPAIGRRLAEVVLAHHLRAGLSGVYQGDYLPPELLGEPRGVLGIPHGSSFPRRTLRPSSDCPIKYSHINHIKDLPGGRCMSLEPMLKLVEAAEPEPAESRAPRRKRITIVETVMELADMGRGTVRCYDAGGF